MPRLDEPMTVGDLRDMLIGMDDATTVVVTCEHDSSIRFSHLVEYPARLSSYEGRPFFVIPSGDGQVLDLFYTDHGARDPFEQD